MPRRRKTQSGDPAQEITSVPGRRYGEGVASAQLQKQMPMPNLRAQETPAAPAPQSAAPMLPTPPAQQPNVDPVQYLQSLNPGLLRQPPTPNVPVTNGLRSGPGAGSQALERFRFSQLPARHIEAMYRRTGDPVFRRMLDRYM